MKYTVPPFSRGLWLDSNVTPQDNPCAICGKSIIDTRPASEGGRARIAVVINGGIDWGDLDSDETDPGYMGGWLIGPDCHRKFQNREAR